MKSLVVANWKMNPPSFKEAKRLFAATKKAAESAKHPTVIVAPPAIFLRELSSAYRGKRISFALQNAHSEAGGAYTGEISLAQATDAGAAYVVIGHAERRAAGETNEDTRKKVAAALAMKITPILCVGESSRNHEGAHFALVKEQLRAGLSDVEPSGMKNLVVVYEPLWTIGAEKAMSPRDMHEMAIFIRKSVMELKGGTGMNTKILYGGSINESNVADMLRNGDVHGLLVGRASEDGEKFSALLQAIEHIA